MVLFMIQHFLDTKCNTPLNPKINRASDGELQHHCQVVLPTPLRGAENWTRVQRVVWFLRTGSEYYWRHSKKRTTIVRNIESYALQINIVRVVLQVDQGP